MMKMIRIPLMGIFLLIWMFGCQSPKSENSAQATLAIGYIPNMQFTPLYVAMHEGMFEQRGLELQIEYGFGNDLMALVAQDKVDFALVDADQFLIAQKQGLPLQAIFQYYEILPTAILALDETIQSPLDLVGKKIGVPELFGSSYLTALEFLHYYQIPLDSVEIVRIGYTQLAALSSGEVDAAVVFANNEPITLDEGSYQLWSSEVFSSLAGSLIIARQDGDEEKRKAFQSALEQGIAWVRNYPEEAAAVAMHFIDGSEFDQTLKGIYATLAFYSEQAAVDQERLDATHQRLVALNLI